MVPESAIAVLIVGSQLNLDMFFTNLILSLLFLSSIKLRPMS